MPKHFERTENIRSNISKFRCFHDTKQAQNEVGKFFYNLAELVFEYFCDSRLILATFTKLQHDRTVT